MNLSKYSGQKHPPYGTVFVAAVNVFYFFYLLITGTLDTSAGMIDKGALFILNGTYMGGIGQIFMSMFMHFDIYHLGGNLLMMVIVGEMLEERLGSIRFLAVYFISGVIGNIATIFLFGVWGRTVVSAGASGAVFGLVGTLLCLVFRNRGSVPGFSRNRMILMVFLLFYNGYANAQVNTVAHGAGFLTGIFMGLLFQNVWKSWQKNREDGAFSGM